MGDNKKVPELLMRDRYWKGLLFLFSECDKLNMYFTNQYFDLEAGTVKITALKKISGQWSPSEKFMLHLALHLFNPVHKVDLSEMDRLDHNNTKLAFKAMELRYR